MVSKVLWLALLSVALAEEHAYSSQSITRHDQHEHGHQVQYQQAAAPVHQQYKQAATVSNAPQYNGAKAQGHAISSQSIVRHNQPEHGHQQYYQQAPAPVHQQYQQAATAFHAPQNSGAQSHGHAVSSQSIVRHDSHQAAAAPQYHVTTPQYHVAAPQYHVAPIVHQAPVYHAAPVAAAVEQKEYHHEQEYYAHPKYDFEYKVSDPHTGDNKYQQESRDGDVVTGVYWLHEADGSIRTVKYHADKHNGFNAEVHSEGTKHTEQHHH